MAVADPEDFVKGRDAARIVSNISPVTAIIGGVYAFSFGNSWGAAGGSLCFIYAVLWMFANGTGFALTSTRNIKATRSELRKKRGPKGPA